MPLYDAGHVKDETLNLSLFLVSSAVAVAVLVYVASKVLRSRAEIRQWPYGAKLFKKDCEGQKVLWSADGAIASNHSPQQAAEVAAKSPAEAANPLAAAASSESAGADPKLIILMARLRGGLTPDRAKYNTLLDAMLALVRYSSTLRQFQN